MRTRIIAMVTCLPLFLAGCRQAPQESIIGKWQQAPKDGLFTRVSVSGPGVMTFDFRSDGTLITQGGIQANVRAIDGTVHQQGGTSPVKHRYAFVDDHTVKISWSEGILFKGQEATFRFTGSGKHITLTETAPSGLRFVKNGALTLRRAR